MGIRMSRHWNRDPHWFDGLPRENQIALLADWNLSQADPKAIERRKSLMTAAKLAELRRNDGH